MSGIYGADVAELRALSKRFDQCAQRLDANRMSVGHTLAATVWLGPVALRFKAQWDSEYSRQVHAAAQRLRDAAQELSRNADEQDRASAANGVSAPDIIGDARRGVEDIISDVRRGAEDLAHAVDGFIHGVAGGIAHGIDDLLHPGDSSSDEPSGGDPRTGSQTPEPAPHSAPPAEKPQPAPQIKVAEPSADINAYREFEKRSHPVTVKGESFLADENGMAVDNCTAWVAWRRESLGLTFPRGNGGEMAGNAGGTTSTLPEPGSMVSYYTPGSDGQKYGHVMIVEKVNADGSFEISETNYNNSPEIKNRTWSKLDNGTWKASDGQVAALTISGR